MMTFLSWLVHTVGASYQYSAKKQCNYSIQTADQNQRINKQLIRGHRIIKQLIRKTADHKQWIKKQLVRKQLIRQQLILKPLLKNDLSENC